MRQPNLKYLQFFLCFLLSSCQFALIQSDGSLAEPHSKSKVWRVEDVSFKENSRGEHSSKFRLDVYLRRVGLMSPKIAEHLQKISWVNTTYDDLALPMVGPRFQIVQKSGGKFYLIAFYEDSGDGFCLRYEAGRSFGGYKYKFSRDEQILINAPSSESEVGGLMKLLKE